MAVAAIAALSSCSSDNEVFDSEAKKALTFTARMESIGGTRATLDNKSAKWEEGDEIYVIDYNNKYAGARYKAGSDGVTFTASVQGVEATDDGAGFEAFFPANIISYDDAENKYIYELPATIEEEYGHFNMPMYGVTNSSSNTIDFTNLCGVLAIKVTSDQMAAVKGIRVSSSNRAMSGKFGPGFDESGNVFPSIIDYEDASKTLTVTYTDEGGVETETEGKVFYIAIPPSFTMNSWIPTQDPYENLKIELSADGTDFTKSMTTKKDADILVERNKIYNITFKDNTPPTTGTAKATIGGEEVDVKWVQLWAGGPKFAEYNIGASSVTDLGITMTFSEATSAEYVWGAYWCTPSKGDMDELLKAATDGGSEKVACEYIQEDGKWGFKFTGLTDGYKENSVFFPAQLGNSNYGFALYWSATAGGSGAWYMSLYYYHGGWDSNWYPDDQDELHYVRPVLKN